MATLPSRRDSSRTKRDFLALVAEAAVKKGEGETEFVQQFRPQYQPAAAFAYQQAEREATPSE